jgi:hypothetical protein
MFSLEEYQAQNADSKKLRLVAQDCDIDWLPNAAGANPEPLLDLEE